MNEQSFTLLKSLIYNESREQYKSQDMLTFMDTKKNCLLFSFVWSLFEKYLKDKKDINNIKLKILNNIETPFIKGKKKLFLENEKTVIDKAYNCIKQRYQFGNNGFEQLLSYEKNIESKKDLKNYIDSENQDLPNKVKAILMIAYRLRNNFFHGGKELNFIDEQEYMFECINEFLLTIIKYLKDS